jgi:hypothetical protein
MSGGERFAGMLLESSKLTHTKGCAGMRVRRSGGEGCAGSLVVVS